MTRHTSQCEQAQAAYVEWTKQNFQHCQACHGNGSDGRPSDPSVGMFDPEPCDHCLGEGRCPRCGHLHGEEWERMQCESCIWNWDDPRTHSPYQECWCGYDEMEKELAEEEEMGRAFLDLLYDEDADREQDYALGDYLFDTEREKRYFGW